MEFKGKDNNFLGIDLDEVIASFVKSFSVFYEKEHGRRILYEDVKSYNFWENNIGLNREEAVRLADDFYNSRYFDQIPLIDGTEEAIDKLSLERKICIVTSHPQRFKDKTETFVKKNFYGKKIEIIYSGDFYVENGSSKAEICEEIGIRDFLEDNLEYACECAEKGVRVFLFDKPWNQGDLHGEVVRVKDWNKFFRKFKGCRNGNQRVF